MIFGMGPMELTVILLVVLVIFGPKNLPKLGSTIGKTVKSVREGMEDVDDEPAAAKSVAAEPAADPQISQATPTSDEDVE